MTLKIRVEKADATDFVAEIQQEVFDQNTGQWVADGGPQKLNWPADTAEFTVWSGKRLVISENGSNQMIYLNRIDYNNLVNRAINAEKELKELKGNV